MKHYCLGFIFTPSGDHLWMVRKNRPEWQAGLLNGIGGKLEVELGEDGIQAQVRETFEETGWQSHYHDWRSFHTMKFEDATVYCYTTKTDAVLMSMTDEEIVLVDVDEASRWNRRMVDNMFYLIPMAWAACGYDFWSAATSAGFVDWR